MDMTLLRVDTTRARNESESPFQGMSAALAENILRLLNGCWLIKRIQHMCFEVNCCNNQDLATAIIDITDALVEGFLRPLAANVPSEMRWCSFGPTLAAQSAGHFMHGILPRVMERALSVPTDDDDDSSDEEATELDDVRMHANKKARQAFALHTTPDAMPVICVALLTTEPVDKLSNRLQFLDGRGGSIKELVSDSPTSPLRACHRHLWYLMNPRVPSEHSKKMDVVMAYLSPRQQTACIDWFRQSTMTVGSRSYSSIDVKFYSWPMRLVRGKVGPYGVTPDVRAEHEAFFGEYFCCLDSWWSKWFRKKIHNISDMLREDIQALIRTLGDYGDATNMNLEGLLSQMKAAIPTARKRGGRSAEKQAYAGLLTQLMSRHLGDGKQDSRDTDKDSLQKLASLGVMQRASAPAWGRGDVSFRNWRRRHPQASEGEKAAARARYLPDGEDPVGDERGGHRGREDGECWRLDSEDSR